ncbi:MAG: leucine-rich repeat domain-containing protein [Alistipes sp.]|nr:leucine-rich repeat domain-containing protein [Rikenellaceae bacterium]MBR2169354.1 leucine-rich repeat domain-containing protein [Alistipes sp.]
MKRLLYCFSLAAALLFVGCDDDNGDNYHNPDHLGSFDATEYINVLNSNLDALQAIFEAKAKYAYTTSAKPIDQKGETVGYDVALSNSRNIKIYISSSTSAPTIQMSKLNGDYYWSYKNEILTDDGGRKLKVATTKLTAKIVKDSLVITTSGGFSKNLGYVNGKENIRFFRAVKAGEKESSYKLYNGLTFELRKFAADEVPFADKNVAAICVKHWDTNGDGYLSFAEAEAVTDLGTPFKLNSSITSFEELKYFKNIEILSDSAFALCKSLEKIAFPKTMFRIGGWAFNTCQSLAELPVPEGITYIDQYAFRNCILNDIVLPNSLYYIGNYAFYNSRVSSVKFGSKVWHIGTYAFAYGTMKSVTLPDNITSLGYNPWSCCAELERFEGKFASSDGRMLVVDNEVVSFAMSGLSSYVIPEGITSIGAIAFEEVPFTKITLPTSLVEIGHNAFWSCTKLTEITIPENVTSFGNRPFRDCKALATVYCKPTTPPAWSKDYPPFDGTSSKLKIYVPRESVEAYKADASWSQYASKIEGYDF